MKRFMTIALLLVAANADLLGASVLHKGDAIRLQEYVGREWSDELIHYNLHFAPGEIPNADLRLDGTDGKEAATQLSNVTQHPDGSLKSASVWLVVTLRPNELKQWTVEAAKPTATSDLELARKGEALEVTTARTGARFQLGQMTSDPPVPAGSAKDEEEAMGHYRRVRDEIRDFVGRMPDILLNE